MFNPCCCSCDICLDNFTGITTGTDVSTTNCLLTEEAGDWSIINNGLGDIRLRVSTSSAIAQLNVTPGNSDQMLSVVMDSWGAGDNTRLMFDYVDNDNYLCAQFTHGGTIEILRRTAGVESSISSTSIAGAGGSGAICAACYNSTSGLFTAAWSRTSQADALMDYEAVTNHAFAIGTGTIASANIDFDQLWLEKSIGGSCSSCQQCEYCLDGSIVDELEVVLSGLANQSCSDCATIDGTYLLNFWGKWGSNNGCVWHYEFPSAICGFNHLWVRTHTTLGTLNWLYVVLTANDSPAESGDRIRWSIAASPATSLFDCTAISSTCTLGSDSSSQCAAAGSTAEISVP